MGEMADMLVDQMFDVHDEWMSEDTYHRPKKTLKCGHCHKNNLAWRKVDKKWVIFEESGKVHSCTGYEPPLNALRTIALESWTEAKKKNSLNLLVEAKKRGKLKKIISNISDRDLLDLYTAFIRDDQQFTDEPDSWKPPCYLKEISTLYAEIVRRMS